jgi:hypothetical protein
MYFWGENEWIDSNYSIIRRILLDTHNVSIKKFLIGLEQVDMYKKFIELFNLLIDNIKLNKYNKFTSIVYLYLIKDFINYVEIVVSGLIKNKINLLIGKLTKYFKEVNERINKNTNITDLFISNDNKVVANTIITKLNTIKEPIDFYVKNLNNYINLRNKNINISYKQFSCESCPGCYSAHKSKNDYLSCGHQICRECIESNALHQHYDIKCFVCRTQILSDVISAKNLYDKHLYDLIRKNILDKDINTNILKYID